MRQIVRDELVHELARQLACVVPIIIKSTQSFDARIERRRLA